MKLEESKNAGIQSTINFFIQLEDGGMSKSGVII